MHPVFTGQEALHKSISLCYENSPETGPADGGSSNGRTTDSDSVYRGSSPRPPTIPLLKDEGI
jgi:hypothetical protein